MEELGIPELTTIQMETISEIAENAAKKYILSKISLKLIEKMNIIVESVGEKPITIKIEIDLRLHPIEKYVDTEKITKAAAKEAISSSENYLRKLK